MNTHTVPQTTQPATRVIFKIDNPVQAYADLVALYPDARPLVDRLLTTIASRAANVAQILALHADEWKPLAEENGDQDEATMRLLLGRAEGLAWIRDELGVLMGSGLGRAAQIPAFSNPAVWCDQVPPDAEDEESGPGTCSACRGSGEGMYAGSTCCACRGLGEVGP